MYCYTIMTRSEQFGDEPYCDIISATPLENATEKEIIKAVQDNGGIGGAMILIHMEDSSKIWAKRISTVSFFAQTLLELWYNFTDEWFDWENLKNKLIRQLVKHTHLHATTIYPFLRKVDSMTELQFYVDQIKKERSEKNER